MALFFHRRHIPVSILCPIIPEKVSALVETLEAINESIHCNTQHSAQGHALFHQINTHHFCRWTVLPATTGKHGKYPAQLLFESNIDEPLSQYVTRLVQQDPETITAIYQHCERFTPNQPVTFLKKHCIPTPTYYRGAHYHSRVQIEKDQALHQQLEQFIDEKQKSGSLIDYYEPGLKEQLTKHLRDSGVKWPYETLQRQPDAYWPLLFALILLLPLLVPMLCVLVPAWYVLLRKHETSEKAEPHDNNIASRHEHIHEITKEELQAIQSPMTSVVEIKPGFFRLLTLKTVLWAINLLANIFYNKGKLGSINTIHFARWLIIDNNRRLVFLSNYDGSWENYLGDFIDRAAKGLTAVWSNAEGFPTAKNLILEGAARDQAFKAYARKSQLKTHCWYSAYPQLSLPNIVNNSKIRQGLVKKLEKKALTQWLGHF